jgi:phospholipid/cholesterol/gamma-HCH transport system substrate-binding protein
VVSILVGQKDQIASLLNSTVQLATNANTILDSSPNGLDAMLHDASTVVGTLDSFNSEIGQTLTNMNGLLENFTGAGQGVYLVFVGALDIPGTIE